HNSLLNYVASQHVDHSTVSITAGTGLTGGGDITASRTLNIAATGVTAATYGSATQVAQVAVNAQGQATSATNVAIAIPSTQITDFAESVDDRVAALIVPGTGITATYNDPANTLTIATTITQYTDELAQDAVGNILTDSASVDFTYNDAANTITAAVLPAGVNHDALANFVANEHIDHSAVSVLAGAGMSGGGAITASVTLTNADRGSVAVTTHEAALDPHPQYLTAAEGNAAYQPLDADLTGLAALTATGVIARTAAGTFAARTITAGTGMTVTNGDGVAGNPTLTANLTATPPALQNLTATASAGTSVEMARADHVHAFNTTGVTPAAYGTATAIPVITVNAQGQVTAASTSTALTAGAIGAQPLDGDLTGLSGLAGTGHVVRTAADTYTVRSITAGTGISVSNGDGVAGSPTISSTITQYTDEQAQDAVGGILASSSNVTLTYNDAGNSITADLTNSGVTANTYGSSILQPIITVDAKGRITNVSTVNQNVDTVTGTLPIGNGGTGQTTENAAFNALAPMTTNGDIITRSGGVASRLGIGAAGQVLTVSAGLPSWQSSSATDPANSVTVFDDFLGRSNTSDHQLGWLGVTSGGGSQIAAELVNLDGFGIIQMETGTSSTGRAQFGLTGSALYFGQGAVSFKFRVRIPTLSTGTERFKVYVGFGDNTGAGDQVDGLYFTYTDNEVAGNWRLNSASNSVRTAVDSLEPVGANTWYTLRVEVAADGSDSEFFVNDVSVGTIATNIPTAVARTCGPYLKIEKSVGGIERTMLVDYFWANINFTTPR
ncbi:MAG: beta strand repeat-containing protein, partial [Shewanella sp.]